MMNRRKAIQLGVAGLTVPLISAHAQVPDSSPESHVISLAGPDLEGTTGPVWSYEANSLVTDALPAGEMIIVQTDNALVGLDTETGQDQWISGPPFERPTLQVLGNTLYTYNGALFALDISTGEEKWPARAGHWGPPVADGAFVHAFEREQRLLYSIEAETGNTVSVAGFNFGPSSYVIADGLMFTNMDYTLLALNWEDLSERWSLFMPGFIPAPKYLNGMVFVHGESLLGLHAETGEQAWNYHPGSAPRLATVANDTVFTIGVGRNELHAVQAHNGSHLWTSALFQAEPKAPVYANGTVYATDLQGSNVYALDVETGEERWRTEATEPVDFHGIAGPLIIAGSNNVVTAYGNL